MDFQNIIGQAHAKEILYKTLQHGRIPHAYLFCGPEGAGKLALGIILSKALFCQSPEKIICNQCSNCNKIESFNHPDLVIIFPALKSISVDEERKILQSIKEEPYFRYNPWANPTISIDKIRQIRKQSNLKPLSKYRVIIVNEAEKMTIEAANSLLKILEEPPSFTYFILTTSKPSALLPTIRSRCHQLDLTFLSDQEIESALVEREGVSPEQAKLISRISQGSYKRALEWLNEDLEGRRNKAIDFLRICFKSYLDQLNAVETFSKYDKNNLKDMLNLIVIWLRDALLLFNPLDEKELDHKLVNIDKIDILEKFVKAFDSIDFEKAFENLENAIEMIDRNVNPQLVFTVLLSEFNNIFVLKGKTL